MYSIPRLLAPMATLLNEATDAWSFDKLITQVPNELDELLSYLNGKHNSYQHDHINVIALSRVLIAIKFVSSKKRLLTALKPSIDSLLSLCHDMLTTLQSENKLSESSPWLWLDKILSIVHFPDSNNPSLSLSSLDITDLSQTLKSKLSIHSEHGEDGIPQFLIPEWCFTTTSGMKIFEHNFKSHIAMNQSDGMNAIKMDSESDSDSEDDDDLESSLFGESKPKKSKKKQSQKEAQKLKSQKEAQNKEAQKAKNGVIPKSRTLSKVDFLSFPRPKPPQSATASSTPLSAMRMRKRQKTGISSFSTIGSNDTDRRRKVSAITDRLKQKMHRKNEKKNTMLLSLQQKRQMKEDNDRREQERKYQLEMARIEKERVKRMEQERLEREKQEKEQRELMKDVMATNAATDELDDFDAFMDDLGGAMGADSGLDPMNGMNPMKSVNSTNAMNGNTVSALDVVLEPMNSSNGVHHEINGNQHNHNEIPALSVDIPGTTTSTTSNINGNGLNGVTNHNASASSGEESLDDLLVAPGSEIPNVLKDDINKKKSEIASNAGNTANTQSNGNGMNGTQSQQRIVHSQRELDHYRIHYPDYYRQYMAAQGQNVQATQQVKKVEKKKVVDPEEERLNGLGIPKALHKFKWLHTDCNQLSVENRQKIVQYLTGKYTKEGVEKEDVLLHRTVEAATGIIKDSVFRMMFATKNWKKVVLKKRIKKKAAT